MKRVVLIVGLIGLSIGGWAAPAFAQVQTDQAQADSTYVVKEGDTLFRIARRFEVSVQALRQWNDLATTTVEIGQTLRVQPPSDTASRAEAETMPPPGRPDTTTTARPPADTAAAPSPTPVSAGPLPNVPAESTLIDAPIDPLRYGTYTIRKGDTFYSVAVRYGLSADTLYALNGEHTAPLPPGQVLRLPARFAVPSHVLREDETVYDVAAQYGVSVRALERANGLSQEDIQPGHRLRIPGREAPDPPGNTRPPMDAEGPMAVYPQTFEGRLTASGAAYNPDGFVASHASLPFGTVVLLTNPATGRSTFARVIDRGPVEEHYLMDVSEAVAQELNLERGSEQPIELRVMR